MKNKFKLKGKEFNLDKGKLALIMAQGVTGKSHCTKNFIQMFSNLHNYTDPAGKMKIHGSDIPSRIRYDEINLSNAATKQSQQWSKSLIFLLVTFAFFLKYEANLL